MAESASEDKSLDLDAVLAAERLTELIRRAGRLGPDRHVVRTERSGGHPTIVSTLVRGRLEYDAEAAGAPGSLLLKSPRGGLAPAVSEGARAEALFYRDVAPFSPPDLVPCCLDASTNSDTYVLLEDLSSTHKVPTGWPVPPDIAVCEQLVDAYARFHAAWWDDARLGRSVGRFIDDATAKAIQAEARRCWPMFRAMLGDRLSDERARRYERFVAAMPRLLERLRALRGPAVAPLSRDPARAWCLGLRVGRAAGRLSLVGAVADHHADVAGDAEPAAAGLVESPRARDAGVRGPRLRGAPRVERRTPLRAN